MSNKVTVACKLPNGLILRVFKMEESSEPVMGGGTRTVKVARQVGGNVTVLGNAVPFGQASPVPIVGGYALTAGVDAEFFEEWLAQNQDLEAVRNKLIFAHSKPRSVQAEATAHAKTKSGLESVDPKNLPRGIQRYDGKPAAA